jgi:hypothetical protein
LRKGPLNWPALGPGVVHAVGCGHFCNTDLQRASPWEEFLAVEIAFLRRGSVLLVQPSEDGAEGRLAELYR